MNKAMITDAELTKSLRSQIKGLSLTQLKRMSYPEISLGTLSRILKGEIIASPELREKLGLFPMCKTCKRTEETMRSTYFNTTHIKDKLGTYKMKNGAQADCVLNWFQQHPGYTFTPCELHDHVYGWKSFVPLTSTRRAINTLTKSGYLVKTDKKRLGFYGRLAYTWRLK